MLSRRLIRSHGLIANAVRPRAQVRSLSTLKNGRSLSQFTAKVDSFRRKHTLLLLVTGGVIGAGAMLTLTFVYVFDDPKAIERIIVTRTAQAFSKALTFEARMKIYFSLPDVSLPDPSLQDFLQLLGDEKQDSSSQDVVEQWMERVNDLLNEAGSLFILMAKSLMRRELVQEAQQIDNFEERLKSIRELLPASSIERDTLVADQLEQRLKEEGWLEASHLEANPPSANPPSSCDTLTKLLIFCVAFYPGPVSHLLMFLDSNQDALENRPPFTTRLARRYSSIIHGRRNKSIGSEAELDQREQDEKLEEVFSELRHIHQDLVAHPRLKDFVLQESLTMTIDTLEKLQVRTPYEAYVRAIDKDLLGPLRRDARVTEDILDQVKQIFLAAPPAIQARILLTALRHPYAKKSDVTPQEQATVVRDLLSAGGVVAVKLAQMLAEDPKIPDNYRSLLGSLRDDNSPMPIAEFWNAIPTTIRKSIVSLGPCLGVGSVKQVHKARFDDGRELAVCVLRKDVENEALASLNALEASEELGVVAKRLGRLVYQEFNLFAEGEAVGDFQATRIGRHPKFRVVSIAHNSPKCLVEEIATGPTPAKALRGETEYDVVQIKHLLTEYHRAVFSAFVEDGLIHSDIHLGNAIVERRKPADADDDGLGLVLFDVGQWERISPSDTKALLWVLASISSPERRKSLREAALTSLQAVCQHSNPDHLVPPHQDKELRDLIELSYSEAISPFEDGTVPDQRQAYMLFLRACERNGVSLPKGAFAVAKMIDGIISQRQQFRLRDVAEESMEAFLRKHMSWWEASSVLKGSIATSLRMN